MNYNFTRDEINKIEDESIARGFKIWNGWLRAFGAKVMADMWNKWFPAKEVAYFLVDLFSDEWYALCAKWWVMQVSIRVDIKFINDVRTDNKIDNVDYWKKYGHATCVRWREDLKAYQFIDSAWWNTYYTCTEAQLKEMVKEGNLQADCHVFIPKKLVDMITPDVPENQWYAPAVKWAIDNGITSANKDKNFEPTRPATRAEMVQFLKNFYDLLVKKGAIK